MVQDIHRGDGLKNPINRLYSTNAAEPWHVDDADVVGELCCNTLHTSAVSHAAADCNALYSIAQQLTHLACLCAADCLHEPCVWLVQPYWFDMLALPPMLCILHVLVLDTSLLHDLCRTTEMYDSGVQWGVCIKGQEAM